jgi:hypothetical protein
MMISAGWYKPYCPRQTTLCTGRVRPADRRWQAQGSLKPERRGHDQGHSAEPQLIFSEQSRVLSMRLLTGPDRPGSALKDRHSREVRPWPETPKAQDG